MTKFRDGFMKLGEELELPKEEYQKPILFAFTKIVVKQKTPGGKVWWPAEILNELWRLWSDRPNKVSEKRQFIDRYYQRVGRLRRGVTGRHVNDAFLFSLIEAFVHKHGHKDDVVMHAEQIQLVHETEKSMLKFTPSYDPKSSGRVFEIKNILEIVNRKNEITVAVFQLIGAEKPRENSKRVYLEDKCIAFGVPNTANDDDWYNNYWPIVLFDLEYLSFEIGFYLPSPSVAFFRPVTPMRKHWGDTFGMPRYAGYSISKSLRILDIRNTGESSENILNEEHRDTLELTEKMVAFDKTTFVNSIDVNSYIYSVVPDKTKKNMLLARKLLKFLDLK